LIVEEELVLLVTPDLVLELGDGVVKPVDFLKGKTQICRREREGGREGFRGRDKKRMSMIGLVWLDGSTAFLPPLWLPLVPTTQGAKKIFLLFACLRQHDLVVGENVLFVVVGCIG